MGARFGSAFCGTPDRAMDRARAVGTTGKLDATCRGTLRGNRGLNHLVCGIRLCGTCRVHSQMRKRRMCPNLSDMVGGNVGWKRIHRHAIRSWEYLDWQCGTCLRYLAATSPRGDQLLVALLHSPSRCLN